MILAAFVCLAGCSSAKLRRQAETFERGLTIAVLPVENLAGTSLPAKELLHAIRSALKESRWTLVEDKILDDFMARHRVRYTGGTGRELAETLKAETGVDAVFLTSVELHDPGVPPKTSIFCRLVSTGPTPEILWADSWGLTGDENFGLAGMARVHDGKVLRGRIVRKMVESVNRYRDGRGRTGKKDAAAAGALRVAYRSDVLEPGRKYSVAILPFANRSRRKNAGEIVSLHFLRRMGETGSFRIVDPGVLREHLLRLRMVIREGLSLADADVLFSSLDVDLIVTGSVLEYTDVLGGIGDPAVDFSAIVLERKSREIVWSSHFYRRGDDGIVAFDLGKAYTAHALASAAAASIGRAITEGIPAREAVVTPQPPGIDGP